MIVELQDSTRKVLSEPQLSGYVLTNRFMYELFLSGDIKPEAVL